MRNADGSIAHVEAKIGASIVMLFDSHEGWPETPGFFRLSVDDADAIYQQAIRSRATLCHGGDRPLLGVIAPGADATRSEISGGSRATRATSLRINCRRGCKSRDG
jgi:hypothetical protein